MSATLAEDTGSTPDSFLRAAAATRGAPTPLVAGTVVGRYQVEGLLGRGGMGVVHRATDRVLQRPVALKLLTASRATADVLREARLAARLDHPHVATVFDAGVEGERVFIAMELVEGVSLRARLRGGLPRAEALCVAREVAAALAHAHARGVVHRDLKPENVMVGPRGAKLLDFGIALPADGPESGRGGTPGYMPPERDASAHADVYAFGVLLHELLTGQRPSSVRVLADELDDLVRRCLADPARRPDMRAVELALAARPARTVPLGVAMTVAAAATVLIAGLAANRRPSTAGPPSLVVVAPTPSPASTTALAGSTAENPSPTVAAAPPRATPSVVAPPKPAPSLRAASLAPPPSTSPSAASRTARGGACHLSAECASGWCVAEVCQ